MSFTVSVLEMTQKLDTRVKLGHMILMPQKSPLGYVSVMSQKDDPPPQLKWLKYKAHPQRLFFLQQMDFLFNADTQLWFSPVIVDCCWEKRD